MAGSVGFAPHNVVRAPSRAEKGLVIGAGIYVNAVLQNDAAPVQPPTADSVPTFMVIPPPVKFSALLAGSFEARPQLGALMLGLPWKLKEPVNAKTQGGFVTIWTLAMAIAPMLIVEKPSNVARYAGCCWPTVARTKLPAAAFVQVLAAKVPRSIWTVCEIPVGRLATQLRPG